MMDPRMSEMTVRLQHRHRDGSWSDLQRRHDPAGNDPERGWNDADLYICSACEEEVRVSREHGGQSGGR